MPTNIYVSRKIGFGAKRGKGMSLEPITDKTCKKTCCWCVMIVMVALTLLALTWTVILASNTSVLGMIKIIFPD